MRAEALRHTPMGILTRGVSGIAGRTLIINFPGNPKAIGELFPVIAPTLEHAVATLQREGGEQNPRPLSCAASPATSASGPRCARSRSTVPGRRDAWPCWAATGPASRRCCGSWPRCCAPTPARCWCSASRCRAGPGRCAQAGAARPRAAALPRADRAREPRYHARLHRVAPERVEEVLEAVRDGAPGRRSGAPALARDGAAPGGLPAPSCTSPELLLLDEPRANLDPAAGELVEPLIGRCRGPHAGADQPRPAGRAGRGRPRAGAQGRPPGVRRAARRAG